MRQVIYFFQLFCWFSIRNLMQHRGRALAVILGIALGAAVFTSVRLSINAALDAFTDGIDTISGNADRIVMLPGGRVPDSLVAALSAHPLVESATPILSAYVHLKQSNEEEDLSEPFILMGLDSFTDRAFRNWSLDKTQIGQGYSFTDLVTKPFSVIMGKKLAGELNISPGDSVSLECTGRDAGFTVLGILAEEGLAFVEGGRVAIADIATFQEFTGLYGKVDRIDIKLLAQYPQITDQETDRRISKFLPRGILLKQPDENRDAGRRMIRAYQLNLSVLSFVSLFVGMFLVYSLVALNAASRQKELAILRALGASRQTVFMLFVFEGGFLGLMGWILAFPAGSFLVKGMVNGISETISVLFVKVYVDNLNLDLWEMLLSFIITVLVSVLAALEPAYEAMQVSPKSAMTSGISSMTQGKTAEKLAVTGLIFILSVWPLSRIPAISGVPIAGYGAVFMLFAGFSILSPFFLRLISSRISPWLRRFAGEPAYLAGKYLQDSGIRVAVSVGSLITAVALFSALVIMIHSFRSTVTLWLEQTVSGDIFILPRLGSVNDHRNIFPKQTLDDLKQVKTDVDKAPYRRFHLLYETRPYQFEIIDLEIFLKYGSFTWIAGNHDKAVPELIQGKGAVITEVFANQTSLGMGDRFKDQIEGCSLDIPIIGIIRDYRSRGGVVIYSLKHFESLCSLQNPKNDFSVYTGIRYFFKDRENIDQKVAELRTELIELCGDRIEIIIGRELRRNILKVFDETFAITTVLLIIALTVAALGIATTLAVQVLERSRQLNTLYAIGASRRQIRNMIFWESSLMVIAGEAGGLICGFLLSFLLVFVINKQSFGWTFIYAVNWKTLIMSLPLIFAAAMTAAMPAIKMVFREPPASLLRL